MIRQRLYLGQYKSNTFYVTFYYHTTNLFNDFVIGLSHLNKSKYITDLRCFHVVPKYKMFHILQTKINDRKVLKYSVVIICDIRFIIHLTIALNTIGTGR